MNKVNKQTATLEFEKWVAAKKMSASKVNGDGMKSVSETIISEIEDGNLTLNENNEWVYDLKFPVKTGDTSIDRLVFKPRVQAGRLDARYKKLDMKDINGRYACIIAELTGENEGIAKSLDTEDSSLCNAIASYFF